MSTEIKKGALRKQLEIPADKKVPKTLIRKINSAKVGTNVHNPTKTGKRVIPVTKKLHKRTFFVQSFY